MTTDWIALDDHLAAALAELTGATTAADTCLCWLERDGQRPDAPTYMALIALNAHLLALADCRRTIGPYVAAALDAADQEEQR